MTINQIDIAWINHSILEESKRQERKRQLEKYLMQGVGKKRKFIYIQENCSQEINIMTREQLDTYIMTEKGSQLMIYERCNRSENKGKDKKGNEIMTLKKQRTTILAKKKYHISQSIGSVLC